MCGINPLPYNDKFRCTGGKSILKTLWEKMKMLVSSIFFFSHNVFYPMKDNFNVLSNILFVVCKCFQFGKPKVLSTGKGFKCSFMRVTI